MRLTILMPVYDDWEPAEQLIYELDGALSGLSIEPRVLLIDDHSSEPPSDGFLGRPLQTISSVDVVRLRRNLGHQRAICIGLAHVRALEACDATLVMDADGQDRPADAVRLIRRFSEAGGARIIFAERTKRLEGAVFRAFYNLYRGLHRLLTGIPVRIGNFSIIPANRLSDLAVVPELWNHYAAAVLKARLAYETMPAPRGARLGGRTSMSFARLVIHGLSALSVFAEIVCVRLLLTTLALAVVSLCVVAALAVIDLATALRVPLWASWASLILLLLSVLLITVTGGACLLVLFNRSNMSFIPARDYAWFIHDTRRAA